jgi:CheY-like chemotaxis protein
MSKRLLLVEDEFLIRLLIAECLSEAGFDVVEAEDGDAAILLMDQPEAFDLLITDIQMPGQTDGNAVATLAKQRYPGLPVIYASGRPETLRNEVRDCDAFVSKPFAPSAILTATLRALETTPGQRGLTA